MAIIPVPDPSLLIVDRLDLDVPAQSNRSGWTGSSQTVGLPGAATWTATAFVRSRVTTRSKRPWRAFIARLAGIKNSFRLPVQPYQRLGANPTVAAGAGDGFTIPLTGFPPNTYVMRAGMYAVVPLPSGHERLVMLTDDLKTDGSGNAVATFEPDLGEVPEAGALVETVNPWLLAKQTQRRAGWPGRVTGEFTLDLEEAR